MIRTSLDAAIAAAVCFALTTSQTTPINAPKKPALPLPRTATPPHSVTSQPQRQSLPQRTPLQPSTPAVNKPTLAQQPGTARPGTAPLPAQSAQRYPQPAQPAQRSYPGVPAQAGQALNRPQPNQHSYQLPASGTGYGIPSNSLGARAQGASTSPGLAFSGRYSAPRPVPAYSSWQIRGFQAQALRGPGPGAGMAAMHMGDIYGSSAARQPDPVRAARWYAYSTHMGNVSSAYSLGQLYLFGQGVPVDITRAYALMGWAAQNGDPDAQSFLASNPAPPLDPAMANAALPPPPPPPAVPPADNSGADGSDIIGGILLGTVALGVLAVALGSNASDVAQPQSDHGGSLEMCASTDDLGRLIGYDTSGVAIAVKGCVH